MRIFIILITLLYPYYLQSKVINLQYEINWKSIHLADIFWKISFNNNEYDIDFFIKSYGITDKIYNYESFTNINGMIEDNNLNPISYRSKTKSSNQDVYSNIDFRKNGSILNIDISKNVDESQIILQNELIKEYIHFTDPISQLSQYILFKSDSNRMIIDGLNIYELVSKETSPLVFKENNPTIYNGEVDILNLTFPFFKGLHKIDKKNNLKEIVMYYTNIKNVNIPIQYDIFSKKFNANLYLKKYEINLK